MGACSVVANGFFFVDLKFKSWEAQMFRSLGLLGRWKGWDHIRGIKKVGGSIHIRHTHGSKGRYDRLSSKFGIRDGRRHISNHMKGGLGIKLGGGLFGLRIARQSALSQMTPDELDLELHGHPNITNPYRNILGQHPDLEGVVRNPSLRTTFLIAMPRVQRVSWSPVVPLPVLWQELLPKLVEIAQRLESSCGFKGQQVALILCTTDLSVSLQFESHEAANSGASARDVIDHALKSLYHEFCRGVRIDAPTAGDVGWVTIDGKRMLINCDVKQPANQREISNKTRTDGSSVKVVNVGLADHLKRLSQAEPSALRMHSTLFVSSPKIQNKHDSVTPDAETADDLIRWFIYNNDPRAHFNDAAPHACRHFSIHTLVDCVDTTCSPGSSKSTAVRSAVGNTVSGIIRGTGYRLLKEDPLQLANCLSKWSVEARTKAHDSARRQVV